MTELKWIEIDLGGVRRNLRWVRSRLQRSVRLMAVVKANGYGHGAVEIAKLAMATGASSLGVLTPAEANVLRKAGIRAPIQLLAPILPQNAAEVARLGLIATVEGLTQARALNAATSRPLEVHLDLDFGLARWGIPPRRLPDFLSALARLKRLRLGGLSTHIDYIPGKNTVEAEEKLNAFNRIATSLRQRHPGLLAHAANSTVLMDFPHWQLDQVRVGNLLYGINRATTKTTELARPWSVYARIIAIRDVPRGRSIGYASEYVASRAMRVATLPIGYSDGVTMEPAERLIRLGSGLSYWGILRGRKAPYVGRCGISHLLVDISAIPDAKVGDAVSLPVRRTAANSQHPRRYTR